MPKLNKTQEKRFDEKFGKYFIEGFSDDGNLQPVKQHLAKELSIQKKEILEKLGKFRQNLLDSTSNDRHHWVFRLDQAIKTIYEM